MPSTRRIEIVLFLVCWFAFAYFNQGGGWNQNSRFAEVRAIVEQGRFAIDDYLVYLRDPARDDLMRMRVDHAEYDFAGKRHRLAWVDAVWTLAPVGDRPVEEGVELTPMIEVSTSGDVGYVESTGHFHPNKPPGTSLLAVPAYFGIYHVERALGIDPDHWFTLNLNVWLTTIFSVGLASAFACVLFFRLAREFADGAALPAVLATLALAFGTTFFPFATILFDHCLTAALLLASFYLLRRHPASLPASVAAGFCAGIAVVTNYVAAGGVVFLGLYALLASGSIWNFRSWNWRGALAYSVGGIPAAMILAGYNFVNFGSALALSNDFQNPLFKDAAGALGMFGLPDAYVMAIISVSPYRGIFMLAPVLVLGVAGWVTWLRERKWVPEARLGIAMFAWFFLVNASFNGYHGGYSAGPRYLVPALPFLALPLVCAFARCRRLSSILLVFSMAQQFLLTATDAQNSLAVGGHARLPDEQRSDDFWCGIVYEYAVPLFFTGHIGPLTEQLLAIRLGNERERLEDEIPIADEREVVFTATRQQWREAVDQGEEFPIMLAAIRGPVSACMVNVFDGLLGSGVWPLGSEQTRWASFNLGELLWPESRLSVVPLLVLAGAGGCWTIGLARRRDGRFASSVRRA
ncbi:MAG: hypothetical protein ABI680_02795 [Chthoniobacteraceae bacterium]